MSLSPEPSVSETSDFSDLVRVRLRNAPAVHPQLMAGIDIDYGHAVDTPVTAGKGRQAIDFLARSPAAGRIRFGSRYRVGTVTTKTGFELDFVQRRNVEPPRGVSYSAVHIYQVGETFLDLDGDPYDPAIAGLKPDRVNVRRYSLAEKIGQLGSIGVMLSVTSNFAMSAGPDQREALVSEQLERWVEVLKKPHSPEFFQHMLAQ